MRKLKFLTKWLAIFLVVFVSSLTILRLVYFSGPIINPSPLPTTKIIDMHVHIAGLGEDGSGCYISPVLRNNFRFTRYLAGFGVTEQELKQNGDQYAVDKLAQTLKASKTVKGIVLLALDGPIDAKGELDLAHTEVYVPNEYVLKQVKRYPNLFYYGASINPNRHDAIARLEQAKKDGAVLIKWIPNIQDIDPADPKLTAFYTKMRELNLPLLSHTGQERAFSESKDLYGDPQRLALPLSLGVTVIAGHIATTGETDGEKNYQRIITMFEQYPNLYTDISSLTQINKLGYLDKALVNPHLKGRLIYGSDFPLVNMVLTSAWYFPLNLTLKEMYEINQMDNPWDRDIALKQALGVPTDIFARSAELLAIPNTL